MKSLRQILREEIDYWVEILEHSNNRLLKRVAHNNILKRRLQISKLDRGLKV